MRPVTQLPGRKLTHSERKFFMGPHTNDSATYNMLIKQESAGKNTKI
jgi:hypothetical protein